MSVQIDTFIKEQTMTKKDFVIVFTKSFELYLFILFQTRSKPMSRSVMVLKTTSSLKDLITLVSLTEFGIHFSRGIELIGPGASTDHTRRLVLVTRERVASLIGPNF